ncbi:MAG: sigma-54-dependent Fis family transcriptional regulator [Myxococcales bacterium]
MSLCARCKRILVAEDEKTLRVPLAGFLRGGGAEVLAVEDGEQALAALRQRRYDLVITDVRMPGADGLEVLRTARQLHPDCHVILITAFASVDTAVAALRLGATDYLVKPFRFAELEEKLAPLCARADPSPEDPHGFRLADVVCCSRGMQDVLSSVRRIAPGDANVLITGETGAGKEVVAEAIHHFSRRAEGPFVRVNCAAIPDSLFESELFGHEKGAFTGAVARRAGRLEAAHGGTILLDEVASLSLEGQAKLLRAIQTRQFERVGSSKPITVDVRVIAAAQDDLPDRIERGTFRKDLYYRLGVFTVRVPPLRERVDDVGPLAAHFVTHIARRQGRAAPRVGPAAKAILESHPFPGNVRELQNVMERAVTLCGGDEILPAHICLDGVPGGSSEALPGLDGDPAPLGDATARFERAYIERALEDAQGNRSKAADALGISRKTLWEKLRKQSE